MDEYAKRQFGILHTVATSLYLSKSYCDIFFHSEGQLTMAVELCTVGQVSSDAYK